jgi:hypothetical protein
MGRIDLPDVYRDEDVPSFWEHPMVERIRRYDSDEGSKILEDQGAFRARLAYALAPGTPAPIRRIASAKVKVGGEWIELHV